VAVTASRSPSLLSSRPLRKQEVAAVTIISSGDCEGHDHPRPAIVAALAFSFDGSLLAVGLEQGTVELWDTRSWQRLGYPLVGAEAQITALVFDLSGGWLTVASVDGTVKRWLVDPQAWATAACALTDRSMSETEWSLYFGSAAYNPACQRLIECKGK